MTATQLLDKLQGVRRSGAGWMASCPAHPDRSPSLSVREGERGLLLHCFRGCVTEDVCSALRIHMGDLFFEKSRLRPAENSIARQAQRDAAQTFSRNLPRSVRDSETTVIYASEDDVDAAIARALTLTVEGELIQVVLQERKK
jgi:hypothetical protein